MEIKIRHVSNYTDVCLVHDGAMFDIGFLNERERRELAEKLQDASNELLRDLPGKENPAA